MLQFLAQRIGDPQLLRLVRRFLKAGVWAEGVYHAREEGTPQGGLVSPALANIYLHYVLDLWFEKRFARACEGRAYLVGYADDFVACFSHESDGRRFREALVEQPGQFGLEVEPTKTALLCFASQAAHLRQVHALEQPATFNFLGFTHDVGRSRRGKFVLARKTQRDRMAKKLKAFGDRLKQLRNSGALVMMLYACQHLRGHLAYYAVSGNSRSLRQYFYAASRVLFKWLNRRSQRRRFSWQRFGPVLRDYLPPIRIRHQLYPAYGE